MSNAISRRHTVLAAAVAGVLALGAVASVQAQTTKERQERRAESKKKDAGQPEAQYPEATRTAPEGKASSKGMSKLKKLMGLYDDDKGPEARAAADEIIGSESANDYERAFAAQLAAQVAYNDDDTAAATAYLKKAIELDALDNNNHFNSMLMLGQVQLQEDQYAEALATFDRFLNETKSQKPEHSVLKAGALYRLDRYGEAIPLLKQAIAASPEPKTEWQSLLMQSYVETEQATEAVKLAEEIAAKSPTDRRAQTNLAVVYLQSDMYDKAAVVLEKQRAAGLFTEDKDYRQLYSTYLQIDGKEREAASVITEGLEKGVLKPDYQAYLALAQSYYFSDQIAPAIDAYKKAAPLAPDGETYLNLAKVLWQEDRIGEAKEAARQATAKGLKRPDEAKKILALPGK